MDSALANVAQATQGSLVMKAIQTTDMDDYGRRWRCRECGHLLGIVYNERLFVEHKKYKLEARGEVSVRCPICAYQNELETIFIETWRTGRSVQNEF